jgi:hypothetical protein
LSWRLTPSFHRNADQQLKIFLLATMAGLRRQRCSCSHDVVIRVYDEVGNVIETHKHKGDFKEC